MIFQAVVLLKKAMGRSGTRRCGLNSPLSDKMEIIFDLLRDVYLLYEHEWVPLIAVDIISISLNKLQLTEEETKNATALSFRKNESVCIFLKNSQDLQELLSKLWTSMRKSDREDVLAKGAYSLVQLISVAARLKTMDIFVDIVSSIRRSVNSEVVKNPGVTTIVSHVMSNY
ncbi:hypothetical protein Ocin01_16828 [Orchesella cincta]|uniref:Uncharacterized protein n=1 Tax=Orchesella cincta TaxID=48709 RepID=A0A1D2MAE6_ORCCI|nr:hypothetical protein Ocin01_16828 [Orchesella cincta]